MANHFDRQYCGKCSLTYVYNKPEEGGSAKPEPAAKAEVAAKPAKAEAKSKGKK